MDGLLPTADEGATRELVARMQAGDERAWEELYASYHDELLFYVRARLGSGLRAVLESEDVFQSVVLEALRSLPRFEPRGPGSLRSWLRAIVLGKIRDRADTFGAVKRAGGVPLSESVADSLAAPAAPAYADPLFERLERALADLPAEMREVVILRRVEERSSSEVAERLGKSEEAVRQTLSRALARLALRLGAGDEKAGELTMDERVEALLALVFERRERGEPVDLDQLAGGDRELARALEQALAHGVELEQRLRGVARVAGQAQADSGGVGTRIGPYVVLGEIARGGMGRVLLAEDPRAAAGSPAAQIALKLLDGLGTLGTRGRERFRREAAILRGLVHPGVVRVLDADVDRATPWIAMELVPGETLAAVLGRARAAATGTASRPFSPTQAAAIGARLARAVEAVHAAGVLHRDVKPANVILAAGGRVVLVDFGLVREEGTATLTRTGDLLGTPQYMAPEQARGERADERSDVYGVGAVLYELLSLRPPHGADGGASDPLNVLARVRKRSAEPLARVAPEVPRDLARVVMRALAFRRARRTPTAAALARDLEAFARGEPVVARGPSAVERADELWRRQRARLPLAAAAVLGATAMVVGTRWMSERARHERRVRVEDALASWIGGEKELALASARGLSADDEPFAPLLVALAQDEDAPASDHPAVAAVARGWSASRAGRHAEALSELRAACELAPEDPVPVVVLAQAAERARDYELAAREYRAAVERVPRADVHARLSYAHYKLGNVAEAEQAIRAAIELAPDDPDHRFAHARVLGALKRREDALAAAQRGAELAGDGASKVQLQILSAALDQADRHAEARDVLRRVLVRWPGDAQALHNLAFSLQLDHELREALEVCEELARSGDRAFALATQAWIRAGSDRATCADCQRVYEQDPDLLDPAQAEELALEALRLGGSDQVPLVVASVAKALGRPTRIRALLEELQAGEQEDARIALFERALRQLAE